MVVKHRMFRSQANRVEKPVGNGVILRREKLRANFKSEFEDEDGGGSKIWIEELDLDLELGLELGLRRV